MIFPQYMKDDWAYCISRALGCLLASAGSSSNVFTAARGIYNLAKQYPGKIEEGIDLITRNPRMRRHITTLGCEDLVLTQRFFENQELSSPRNNCQKLLLFINLTPKVS